MGIWSSFRFPLLLFLCVVHITGGLTFSESLSKLTSDDELNEYRSVKRCGKCHDCNTKADASSGARGTLLDKDTDILASYSDLSGKVKLSRIKLKNLSPSWALWNPGDKDENEWNCSNKTDSAESDSLVKGVQYAGDHNLSKEAAIKYLKLPLTPVKLKRRITRQNRIARRTAMLIRQDINAEDTAEQAAVKQEQSLGTKIKGKYSIWRRDFETPLSDNVIRLMRDQVIMGRAFANMARSNNETDLYSSLMTQLRESQNVIAEATTDAELHPSALEHAKAMGHILAVAQDRLFECSTMARKLRAMLQSTENRVSLTKTRSAFLIQLAAKTVPRSLHCIPLKLSTDYYLNGYLDKKHFDQEKVEDPLLFHYAIFSDNVLATSVVVNSTVLHVQDTRRHVFHIVTDKLNFAAMKMWFIINPPGNATVHVQNIDEFKWLNASYCSVLRQLETARMKEYYFKANHPSTITAGTDNLKYRNPKYLSMLNHLRFYLPEVYPKLDKILFLDDDIVVQKDLTPLWSINLQGMVNGAVETCKESFHRFDKYLNFSNPKIYQSFDRNACGWAFGMNMFDLKQWKRRNITEIYHRWQDANEDRTLWKLGTLPPGLITFYNLTFPLDRSWHALGLGYDPALNLTEVEGAAVVHYNGNYKPWLDLAISKYKSYWSRYVPFDNHYLQLCGVGPE